ncbi:hypothetical protein VKT23_005284 [Stygiomarasmius scandens]|uniref:Uncharacterized protein n=1 Tax=Marasmiellus scandens TaxID=2682957 RepID=A0ABR1JQM5_9AGAR
MRRGRSSTVSAVALRRATSERRLTLAIDDMSSPPTSGCMTPDNDDLDPPLSLSDQVHVAYALDDIHLAKILLLKLKGIEVTSDSDPRIAAVQPEDFDECFLPNGPFMSEEDEEAIKEMQRKERERLEVEHEKQLQRQRELEEERRRKEWEEHCERIWEREKKRLREEKAFIERKKEEERKRHLEAQRRRSQRSSKISYAQLGQRPVVNQDLMYNVPKASSSDIAFKDVLTSMRGPLFPPERSASKDAKRRDAQLLSSLLVDVKYQGERSYKGKEKAVILPPSRQNSLVSSTSSEECPACSPSSPSSSSRSWFSFSPSSSLSTNITTPSTSASSFKNWLRVRAATNSAQSQAPVQVAQPCTCGNASRKPYTVLTPISLHDSPLLQDPVSVPDSPDSCSPQSTSSPPTQLVPPSTSLVVSHLSNLLTLANKFQSAYLQATVFAQVDQVTTLDSYGYDEKYSDHEERERIRVWKEEARAYREFRERKSKSKEQSGKRRHPRLRPVGYRASREDISRCFSTNVQPNGINTSDDGENLSSSDSSHDVDATSKDKAIKWIPLQPLISRSRLQLSLPKTKLPTPLPFPIFFKPQPTVPLTLSPMRRVVRERQQQVEMMLQHKSKSKSMSRGREVVEDEYPREREREGRFAHRPSSSPPREFGYSSSSTSRGSSFCYSYSYSRPPNRIQRSSRNPTPRPRYVANPFYLRVKALNNLVSSVEAQRMGLVGAGAYSSSSGREGSFYRGSSSSSSGGSGGSSTNASTSGGPTREGGKMKEKVVGVAYEDAGRSLLGLCVLGDEDEDEEVAEVEVEVVEVEVESESNEAGQVPVQVQVPVQRGRPATPVMLHSASPSARQQRALAAAGYQYPEAGYVRRGSVKVILKSQDISTSV